MIDYIAAKFPCKHDTVGIKHFRQNYRSCRIKVGGTTIEVKSLEQGRFIAISGNPVKSLQGHNIFGSNDLRGLCRDLFLLAMKELGINVKRSDQAAIDAGQYSLSRVDLALNFRLPSEEIVSKAIREIEWHWRENDLNVSNYGRETVYLNQHSKVASTKIYDKRKEVLAHPLPENLLGKESCNRLRRYTGKLLRVEFVLRSTALRKLNMNIGAKWTTQKAKSLIQDNIKSLIIARDVQILHLPEEYKTWKPELRQIYRLWLQGNDLDVLFEKKTLQRRRKALLEIGIDIRIPPAADRVSTVSISSLLAVENAKQVPRFAKRRGLFYKPTRP